MSDVELALAAARAGADVVRRHFGRAIEADMKGRFDPVTVVDHEAEAVIVATIAAARPSDGILAEEGSGSAAAGRRWIIDPLDGTVNFVHGIPQVGVSVALYENDDPLVAVSIDPLRDEEFTAVAGEGAQLNGTAMRVSATATPTRAVIATGFSYDHDQKADQLAATVAAVLGRVNGLRRMGSAVLDMAWVAAGRYDGYWELDLAPWDIAAGILLVQEAGGVVSHPSEGRATPEGANVIATNPSLHEFLRSTVADSRR